ncbi:helix-turn-helix domain-containing protein [Apilactobacillus ozensis]|uniref:helix-turn-helix domain-containing protein n=1 Tax=Apilactobacillus ozensis TaxID=866801 RepID=UPI00200AD124|nr:helix-turn-helix transcriptional regulator [Apilactobacillus ozensis]MCK8607691.1 helix-turn-helix domain-containing protein [Apilactobacillus ozensis]
MNLSEKIIHLRNQKNLTQEQLANNLQVSRSTISSWETGRSYPDLEMIVRICDFFNVSLDYILRNDEKIVRKISLDSRKKKTLVGSIIGLIIFIVVAFTLFLYYAEPSSINPTKLKIIKVTKVPVTINKKIHGKYIKKDYKYYVYAKLNTPWYTWDKNNNMAGMMYNDKVNKYFLGCPNKKSQTVIGSFQAKKSLNIFKNIQKNKFLKLEIPAFSTGFNPKYDADSPYNIGKEIIITSESGIRISKENTKVLLTPEENK